MGQSVLDLGPERQGDEIVAGGGLVENALQVGAVDDAIGRAPARARQAERDAHQFRAIARPANDGGLRLDHPIGERRAKAELRQDPRGIGRELQAGADLLQHGRLLEHRHAEAPLGERQRRGEAAYACPRDGDALARHGASARLEEEAPCVPSLDGDVGRHAFAGFGLVGRERRCIDKERRAIGADSLVAVAHVEKDVGMVEGRPRPPCT